MTSSKVPVTGSGVAPGSEVTPYPRFASPHCSAAMLALGDAASTGLPPGGVGLQASSCGFVSTGCAPAGAGSSELSPCAAVLVGVEVLPPFLTAISATADSDPAATATTALIAKVLRRRRGVDDVRVAAAWLAGGSWVGAIPLAVAVVCAVSAAVRWPQFVQNTEPSIRGWPQPVQYFTRRS